MRERRSVGLTGWRGRNPRIIATALAGPLLLAALHAAEAGPGEPAFAAEALDVYQGKVAIRATFPKGALAAGRTVRATVQACDDRACLPPADLPVTIEVRNRDPG